MALPSFLNGLKKIEETQKQNNYNNYDNVPMQNIKVNVVDKNKDQIEINKTHNTKRLIDEYLASVPSGGIMEIGCLNSKVLQAAPKHFFDKILEVAVPLTEIIQDALSRSDKARLIAELKENPTDDKLKEIAFSAINNEFLKIDSKLVGGDVASITEKERSIISKYRDINANNKKDKSILLAMIVNEICGLGPLEPLYKDFSIREIICNGPYDIQVEIGGKLHKIEACKFLNTEHLNALINKLYNSVNKELSRTNPYERARLKDNSRVFATHTAIAPTGPNLNIRRHTDDWVSPDSLIEWGALSEEVAEWIGNHIYNGCSFVVNGGTASGKTTMLSALCGYYPNNKRIITIEKNIELKAPKCKLLACSMECIPRKNSSANSIEVTMRDLVECTTQMRPDVIICGEVVGEECYDLVQAGNTGHQVCGTLHSNSSQDCTTRMVSLISQADLIKGKEALELISSSIDLIISVMRYPEDGSRRIVDISEVSTTLQLHPETRELYLPVYPIWEFVQEPSVDGNTKIRGTWKKVGELSEKRQKNHNLQNVKKMTIKELRDLYREKEEQ